MRRCREPAEEVGDAEHHRCADRQQRGHGGQSGPRRGKCPLRRLAVRSDPVPAPPPVTSPTDLPATGAPLAPLLPTLREEPALQQVLGRSGAVLAVAEAARAAVLAALVELDAAGAGGGGGAARGRGRATRGGPGCVPAAEGGGALPGLGDAAVRAGQPGGRDDGPTAAHALWRLRERRRVAAGGGRSGRGRWCSVSVRTSRTSSRSWCAAARWSTSTASSSASCARGTAGSTRSSTGARWPCAARSSTCSRPPPTHPVRIDLWGDEVDRLTEFSVADQRSTETVDVVEIFPARELLPTAEVRERAERAARDRSRGDGSSGSASPTAQTFDGMESWLAWLADREHVLFDLVGDDALIVLCDPRRLRDRAADIVEEEASLAGSLARTWDLAEDAALPRLHVEFDRLLRHTGALHLSITALAAGPDTPIVGAAAWPSAVGDAGAVLAQLRQLLADGYRAVVCAESEGAAERIERLLSAEGLALSRREPGDRLLREPGGSLVVTPLERGCILPDVRLALLAEADLTGRRRTHRVARAPRRDAQRFFEDLSVGDHVVHQHHGVARFGGMVRRTIGGVERDYLLLEYRGDDKLYVPSDQIDSIRLYSGGETPALNRMGGADFARTKAKVRSAVAEIAQELVVLYQKRVHAPGHAFAPDTPWQREMESAFPYQETPDQLDGDRRCEGRHGGADPHGPPGVRRRRLRQDGGGDPSRLQGGAGRQPGGRPGAHDPARPAALPDVHRALRRVPGARRGAQPVPDPRPGPIGHPGSDLRRGRRRDRYPPAAVGGHGLPAARPAGGRRGAALRGEPQGGDQAAARRRGRAHAHAPHRSRARWR